MYYGSILSRMNDSQIDKHNSDMNDPSRVGRVSGVRYGS